MRYARVEETPLTPSCPLPNAPDHGSYREVNPPPWLPRKDGTETNIGGGGGPGGGVPPPPPTAYGRSNTSLGSTSTLGHALLRSVHGAETRVRVVTDVQNGMRTAGGTQKVVQKMAMCCGRWLWFTARVRARGCGVAQADEERACPAAVGAGRASLRPHVRPRPLGTPFPRLTPGRSRDGAVWRGWGAVEEEEGRGSAPAMRRPRPRNESAVDVGHEASAVGYPPTAGG